MRSTAKLLALLGILLGALVIPATTASATPVGRIVSMNDNRCLDADIGTPIRNGTKVQVWDCHGGPNQTWYLMSDDTIRPATDLGYCLDLDIGTPPHNGTKVQLWECLENQRNQRWHAGGGLIVSAYDGGCLDEDIGTPPHNGTKVQMWACHHGPNQRWRLPV